jgi:hypothetical protein
MGTEVKQTKSGKFRFWSTSTDQYITPELSKREALLFLHDRSLREHKLRFLEHYFKFPDDFPQKSTGGYSKGHKEADRWFAEWHLLILKQDNYEELLDQAYEKAMSEISG